MKGQPGVEEKANDAHVRNRGFSERLIREVHRRLFQSLSSIAGNEMRPPSARYSDAEDGEKR